MTTETSDDGGLRAPLLLHSLAELREVILPCLEMAGAATVVEVGAEEGTFTRSLMDWVQSVDGRLYCIEPAPSAALADLFDNATAGELIRAKSPEALEQVTGADAYLIDGDHNYHTVLHELETVERMAAGTDHPLVCLHDIAWPCARRDTYYSPESLPPEAVHPYSYDRGMTVGSAEAVEGGFRGNGEFAVALHEGGPANGVLTAVEDFMDGRDVALAKVPCVFGLGVLYWKSSSYARPLAHFLERYDEHPLLSRLEQNRLALYLKVLELHGDLDDSRAREVEHHMQIRDVSTENRALWARTYELEAQVQLLSGEIENLLNSRAMGVAERVSHVTRLRGAGPGISRERLRAALEGRR